MDHPEFDEAMKFNVLKGSATVTDRHTPVITQFRWGI